MQITIEGMPYSYLFIYHIELSYYTVLQTENIIINIKSTVTTVLHRQTKKRVHLGYRSGKRGTCETPSTIIDLSGILVRLVDPCLSISSISSL